MTDSDVDEQRNQRQQHGPKRLLYTTERNNNSSSKTKDPPDDVGEELSGLLPKDKIPKPFAPAKANGNSSGGACHEFVSTKADHQQSENFLKTLWDSVWWRRKRKCPKKRKWDGNQGIDDIREGKKGSDPADDDDGEDYQVILDTDNNQKIELTLLGYKENLMKSVLYYLVLILSLGFMALVFHWNAHYALVVRRKRCPLKEASYVLIVEKYKNMDSSHHDAVHNNKNVEEEKEVDHEVRYVETVHKVDLELLKEKYVQNWRQQLETEKRKTDSEESEDVAKEKWCDKFLKQSCLFEKPELEIKSDKDPKMSKSPDTVTTLVDHNFDDDTQAKSSEVDPEKNILKIYEHFSHVHHFSVHYENGLFEAFQHLKFFRYKQLRYVWNEHSQKFVKLMGLDNNIPSKLLQPQYGLSVAEQMARRLVYGLNKIEIPMNSTLQLIYLEFLNPFYVFQIFSCILWFFYNYYYYAIVIILMSAFGITMSVIQTKRNQNSLYKTVNQSNLSVDVCNVLIVVEEELDYLEDSESVAKKQGQDDDKSLTKRDGEGDDKVDDGEMGDRKKRNRSGRGMELLKQLFAHPVRRSKRKKRRRHESTRSEITESGESSSSESESNSEFENAEDYLEKPPNRGLSLRSSRRNKDMRKHFLFRQQKMKYLVPGDVIEIPSNGCVMQCDIALLSGNCIMDESMLTGECVPVTKTPLPKSAFTFSQKAYARHILFAGTKLIQTRYIGGEKVLGMVINIGIKTAKGDLIRSILYPPPVDYKFEQDSYKFIKLLGLVAFIGFLYTLITKITRGVSVSKLAVESLDLITIAVPPALPAAMSVGRMYAQKRLKQKNIFCISPRSINVSGSVDLVCFDKTGTLTEDGLDLWAVIPIEKKVDGKFEELKVALSEPNSPITRKSSEVDSGSGDSVKTNITFSQPVVNPRTLSWDSPLLHCMVTCHSITQMDGALRGDPLDLKMFESTGWTLQEPEDVPDGHKYDLLFPTIVKPGESLVEERGSKSRLNSIVPEKKQEIELNPLELSSLDGIKPSQSTNDLELDLGLSITAPPLQIGIIREFPFSSSLQRMSVITRRLDDAHFNIFAKGAPEKIYALCDKRTIPNHFHTILNSYARQGYRIIALAYSTLPAKYTITKVQKCSRDAVEKNLTFLGFCVLENRLKTDTKSVIQSLADANIRTVMVTGDNILTAISVAKNCKMIKNGDRVIQIDQKKMVIGQEDITSQTDNNDFGSNSVFEDDDPNRNPYKNFNFTVINYEEQTDHLNENSNHISKDNHVIEIDKVMEMRDSISKQSCIVMDDSIETDGPEIGGPLTNCHFAVDGNTYKYIMNEYPDLSRVLLARGTIFARMSPDLKQHLVGELQKSDYYVAMCGDGANDCGALKIAHCGISLSDSEASVASPFTSQQSNIKCVLDVIKEGRAALVTSFGIFKFMAAYSLIQFITVMILYSIDTNLTDIQFLYIDLVLISSFAFFFGKTKSTKKALTREIPENSLISRLTILSIFMQILIMASLQATALIVVRNQPWFVPYQDLYDDYGALKVLPGSTLYQSSPLMMLNMSEYLDSLQQNDTWTSMPILNHLAVDLFNDTSTTSVESFSELPEYLMRGGSNRSESMTENRNSTAGQSIGDPMACYENYSVFLVSVYQYIILVIIFSRGAPYREPLRTNYGLLIAIVLNVVFLIFMIFYPPQALIDFFELMEPPKATQDDADSGYHFRLLLFGIIVFNFAMSIVIEKFVLEKGLICKKSDSVDLMKQTEKSRSSKIWSKITCAPEDHKKFQYYDQVIGSQVAPLIWKAILDSSQQQNGGFIAK